MEFADAEAVTGAGEPGRRVEAGGMAAGRKGSTASSLRGPRRKNMLGRLGAGDRDRGVPRVRQRRIDHHEAQKEGKGSRWGDGHYGILGSGDIDIDGRGETRCLVLGRPVAGAWPGRIKGSERRKYQEMLSRSGWMTDR